MPRDLPGRTPVGGSPPVTCMEESKRIFEFSVSAEVRFRALLSNIEPKVITAAGVRACTRPLPFDVGCPRHPVTR